MMRRYCKQSWTARTFAGLLATIPCPALAQEQAAQTAGNTDAGAIADIVVTAQRRTETVMKAPIAITALDAQALNDKRTSSLADLSQIAPGLNVGTQSGVNRLYIRGIGLNVVSNGSDSSSLFNVDGIVISRPAAQLGSFFDVDRVEVLRGPQGTLYGRNATGGAVNIITQRPTNSLSGYLRASYGNYDAIETNGAISGPLNKDGTLLARIAFRSVNHDGYGKNIASGQDINTENSQAVRASLWFKPTDSFDYLVTAEYGRENDTNYATVGFGPAPGYTLLGLTLGYLTASKPRDVASDFEPTNRRRRFALTGIGRLDLSDSITLNSLTSYRYFSRFNKIESDDTSAPLGLLVYFEKSRQVSQEFSAAYTGSRLKGIVGVYYFREKLRGLVDVPQLGNTPSPFPLHNTSFNGLAGDVTTAKAAFTQWTYEPLDHLHLTAGLRYSDERKTHNGAYLPPVGNSIPFADRASFHATTPKVGLDYVIAGNTLLYASFSKGFKSGGYQNGSLNPLVRPEKVDAYEVGIKTALFDRHLQLSLSAFDNAYTDLQVQKILGFEAVLVNAAGAKIRGLEFSAIAAPVNRLKLTLNATYLDAKFKNFSSSDPLNPPGSPDTVLDGNLLPGAPKWSVDGGFQYNLPLADHGSLDINGNVAWKSRIYFDEFNRSFSSQPGVTRVDANIRYTFPNDRLSVTAYAKNIANKLVRSNVLLGTVLWGYPLYGGYEPPRTYGVEFGYRF